MFERYSFVALTTKDLARSRKFWVEQLGCRVTDEQPDRTFTVDAGGLRLCLDVEDGEVHQAGGTDPAIGFKVASLGKTLAALAERGLRPSKPSATHRGGRHALFRDPDGRPVIFTEVD